MLFYFLFSQNCKFSVKHDDWTFGKLDLLHLNLKLSLHQDLFFIDLSKTWMQNNCGKDFILLKMKRQGAIDIGYLKKKFKQKNRSFRCQINMGKTSLNELMRQVSALAVNIVVALACGLQHNSLNRKKMCNGRRSALLYG